MARSGPKINRGGKNTRTAWVTANQPTPPPPQPPVSQVSALDDDELEDEQGSIVQPTQANQNQPDNTDWENGSFPTLSQTQYDNIYKSNKANYSGNNYDAVKMYKTPQAKPSSTTAGNASMKSYSQDLNHRLMNGLKLDPDSKFMDKYLKRTMHNLGQQATLVRGAHDSFLQPLAKAAGINLNNPTQASLNKLIGATYDTKSYSSYSADINTNPFLRGAQSGGREIEIYARTSANTKVFVGARSQTEIVTGAGTHCRITDVKLTNRTAYPQSGGARRVIEVYIDQWS